ncbi:MAG TPA: tRNA lysidine(34) synthetase TilS [Anaeromyxobacteraceae bacterium]|nr:tRNA lysidine(34) synthetase TilS [Anaeromyxobacteraceae bacterium]
MADTLDRRRLVAPGEGVLVALSAGPDSTALVAALAALRDAGRIGSVFALNVDHGLREGCDLDAECARETCARLGVPFESVRVTVGPGNVQAEARRARYGALRKAAARVGATRIATGHTLTDQAETFLMRALRGAGARGLSAIPPRRGAIVRPLIDVAREEVMAFLAEEGLRWRVDPSNASPRYARNALRLELAPVLRRLAPRFERALARAADLLRDDERALARRARSLIADDGSVQIARLRAQPRAVRRRVVRLLWREGSGNARALPAAQVDAVLHLCRRRRPGRLSLPGRVEARVAYGRLALGPAYPAPVTQGVVEIRGPGSYAHSGITVDVALCDGGPGGQPPWPLFLRGRLPGDRIRPERGRGGKKLKAWLIDRKVPRDLRDRLVVLADGAGNVLALPELGIRSAAAGSLRVTVRRAPHP